MQQLFYRGPQAARADKGAGPGLVANIEMQSLQQGRLRPHKNEIVANYASALFGPYEGVTKRLARYIHELCPLQPVKLFKLPDLLATRFIAGSSEDKNTLPCSIITIVKKTRVIYNN